MSISHASRYGFHAERNAVSSSSNGTAEISSSDVHNILQMLDRTATNLERARSLKASGSMFESTNPLHSAVDIVTKCSSQIKAGLENKPEQTREAESSATTGLEM